jgi:hypothetical protein
MKTKIIIILLFLSINSFAQYPVVKTPRGTDVTASIFTGTDITDSMKIILKNYWLSFYSNKISYVGEATKKYNCHAYAWHITEGGDTVWIYSDNYNDDKYWNDTSYIEVYDHEPDLKVSYGGPCWYYSYEFNEFADWCDHSAVTTSQTNTFTSKWGEVCLFEHDLDNCPYDPQDLHYYKLSDPVISSSASGVLCYDVQRTFSESRFTDIDLNYHWSCSGPLTEVSDDDESIYIVKGASQYGQGTISLQVTTPSGKNVFNSKTVQLASAHDIELYCEAGGGGCVGYYYPLWVSPYYYPENIVWGVDPEAEIIEVSPGYASIYFDAPGTYTISAYVDNECGTGNPAYIYNFQVSGGFLLSPNPATEQVTITVNNDFSENITSDKTYEVSILDTFGTLMSQNNYMGLSFKIPVNHLKDGNYFVKINNGKISVTKQLIIKR